MKDRVKTVSKWVVLVLLLAYCAGITVWARGEAARHQCIGIEIEIDGNTSLDSITMRGVKQRLAQYNHKIVGAQLSQINTGDIEKFLSSINYFESVDCMISSGGRLHIRVVPMVPVMRVFEADKSYYINKDGKRIDSRAEFFTDVLPVSGHFSKKFRPRDLLPLVRFIDSDPMMRELVTMIQADNARNIVLIPSMLGHVINYGDTGHLAEKRNALKLFYRQVMPYKGWTEYDTISVKFLGQVVATRRIKPVSAVQTDDGVEFDPEELALHELQPGATNPDRPQKAPKDSI